MDVISSKTFARVKKFSESNVAIPNVAGTAPFHTTGK
jgi:hypothetical protein